MSLKALTTFMLVLSIIAPSVADQLHVGVAAIDITPPVGYRMSGYFVERPSTGIHDPLQAKALVLKQGRAKAALVVCDLIGIPAGISGRARELASTRTGIPAAHIMIAATHSHTGPLFHGALREHFHAEAVRQGGSDPREEVDYGNLLSERLVEVVISANRSLRPAQLSAGVAQQAGISFNRRFHMKDGTVRFNPGKLNPDIVRAAGPIDPDVGIVLAREAENAKPLASLTVFALHLDTVGGTEYGADYPLYLERALRSQLGEGLCSLFGTGTCGDINHIDVFHGRPQKGHEEAERIGTTLARTVASALPGLRTIENPRLAAYSERVLVPLQQYTEAETDQARKDIFKVGSREMTFLEQVKATKVVSLAWMGKKEWPLEVQVFRLDADTAIVALPGEVFVDLGLAIKKASPFKHTLIIELANDAPAYIPTQKAFAEGSYETVNSRVASGGGEKMVELALRLLTRARRQD